jgi:cell division transport system permease protein
VKRLVVFAWEEAVHSLVRSGRSALLSVGTIGVAFLVVGAFLMASTAAQQLVAEWAQAAELSVYLRDEVGAEERAAVEARLAQASGEVAAVEFVGKQAAMERFRAGFPELQDVTASLAANPFPASFEVRLRREVPAAAADALAVALAGLPGVADVRYDRELVAGLLAAVRSARLMATAAALVLLLGAAMTVAAVVRLSFHARHDEIDIMALVGSPLSYIRGPFVMEGALLGGLGALVGVLALRAAYGVVIGALGESAQVAAAAVPFLGWAPAAGLVGLGLAVGAVAGYAATSGWRGSVRSASGR